MAGSSSGQAGRDWRTAARVYTVLAVPMIGLIIFAAMLLSDAYSERERAVELERTIALADDASRLAYEMQKERGYSAGFVGSGGAEFADALAAQRRTTDEVIREVSSRLADPEAFDADDVARRERARTIAAALAELDAMRGQVDAIETTVPDLARFYTGAIVNLLSVSDDPLHGEGDAVAEVIYNSILMAKEFAGRERAAGAAGFGSGQFDTPKLAWFLNMQDRQSFLFDRIRSLAPEDKIEMLEAALESDAAARVRELRQLALDSVATGDLQGVGGSEWFAASTAYLGELLKVERAFVATLLEIGADRKAAATTHLIVVGAIVLGLVAFAAIFGAGTLAGMVKTMRGVAGAIGAIEQSEDNVQVPGQSRKDELGVIARSLHRISSQGAMTARVRAAVVSTHSPILVLDAERRGIFENAAFEQLFEKKRGELSGLRAPVADETGRYDYGRLVEAIKGAEAARRTVTKNNGATTFEVEYQGVLIEASLTEVTTRDGAMIGYAIQLNDATDIRRLEQEIVGVIEAVKKGEFDSTVTRIDDRGFTSTAAHGLNSLIDQVKAFMDELGEALSSMARGDLTRQMSADFRGRFGEAAAHVNANLGQFRSALAQVVEAVGAVRATMTPIAAGAVDLASRAESQVATLEEASATMEEMAASVRDNAGAAESVTALAADSRSRAGEGRTVVDNAMSAMSRIEEGSNKISDILALIDNIAFQTNLLALNAAVEAARAGDAGKGFAVVASEVRTLAQRAGEAARDIRGLIQDSSMQVAEGVELVNRTGEALHRIVDAIEELEGKVADIAVATREQAAGVKEVSSSLHHIDEATQHNASLAESSASSAQELGQLGNRLADVVAQFELGEAADAADRSAA